MLRIVTVFRGTHHLASKRAYDEALQFCERVKFTSLSINRSEPLLLRPFSHADTTPKSLVVSAWEKKPDYDRFLQTYLNSEKPLVWLFNGNNSKGEKVALSGHGVFWIVNAARKKSLLENSLNMEQ